MTEKTYDSYENIHVSADETRALYETVRSLATTPHHAVAMCAVGLATVIAATVKPKHRDDLLTQCIAIIHECWKDHAEAKTQQQTKVN